MGKRYRRYVLLGLLAALLVTAPILLSSTTAIAQTLQVLAQVLDTQGNLYLARERAEQAIDSWQRSAAVYEQVGNPTGQIRSRINQAQALLLDRPQRSVGSDR